MTRSLWLRTLVLILRYTHALSSLRFWEIERPHYAIPTPLPTCTLHTFTRIYGPRAYTVHAHIRSSRTTFTAREITSISRKKNGRPNEGKKVQGHEDKPAEKTAGYRKKNKSKGTKKDQAQVIKRKDTHKGKQSIRPRLSMHHAAIVTRKGQKMRINPPPKTLSTDSLQARKNGECTLYSSG